jgi:hypothetical protein
MTRLMLLFALVLIQALTNTVRLAAQQPNLGGDDALTIRVYRVSDLVLSRPDHPYTGLQLPGKSRESALLGGLGGGGGFGGGGMGGGGGGSGGFFAVSEGVLGQFGGAGGGSAGMAGGGMGGFAEATQGGSGTSSAAIAMDELIVAITSTVSPDTWSQMGGPAVITALRGMLIVKQTAAAHVEIEKLLDALRLDGGVLRGVTIRAWWLSLDEPGLRALLDPSPAAVGRRLVRVDALSDLAGSTIRYRGEITCFDNQAVHIISGEVKTLVRGATPVVGGAEVGYQPIVEQLHTGALLELRPSLVDERSVVLDLASFVTEWDRSEEPTDLPSGTIDRPRFVAHQLATTIRAPLGQPVVVGGLTMSQSAADPAGATTPTEPLYLIVEVASTAADDSVED